MESACTICPFCPHKTVTASVISIHEAAGASFLKTTHRGNVFSSVGCNLLALLDEGIHKVLSFRLATQLHATASPVEERRRGKNGRARKKKKRSERREGKGAHEWRGAAAKVSAFPPDGHTGATTTPRAPTRTHALLVSSLPFPQLLALRDALLGGRCCAGRGRGHGWRGCDGHLRH